MLKKLQQSTDKAEGHVTNSENSSVETTKHIGVEIEVETTLGYELSSSQVNIIQSLYSYYSHLITITMTISLNQTCYK